MEAQLVKSSTSLELKRTFQAPIAQLYQAWIDPEMMNQWYHPDARMHSFCTVDLRVGGRYEIQMHAGEDTTYVVSGVYREIIPQEKLAFTWRWAAAENEEESLVTVLFRSIGDRETELTLLHERLANEEDRDNHAEGWEGTFVQLAAFLS
jgi:uncharacterized protein YndB with AHSA1/START domain